MCPLLNGEAEERSRQSSFSMETPGTFLASRFVVFSELSCSRFAWRTELLLSLRAVTLLEGGVVVLVSSLSCEGFGSASGTGLTGCCLKHSIINSFSSTIERVEFFPPPPAAKLEPLLRGETSH